MGVKRSEKMLTKMKSKFPQLNEDITSHSISQIPYDPIGSNSSHLNTGQKGGLSTDMVTSSKNNTHITKIITKIGKTLGNDIMNLYEDPNKNGIDKQASGKRKRLNMSNNKVTIPKKSRMNKLRIKKDKIRDEEQP